MKIVRTVSEADLARLKHARHEADRRYNEALTALDAAIQALPRAPERPPAPDEAQVTPLNERWEITRAVPAPGDGVKGRLARFVLRLVQPALQQQQAFNSALVDHVNRNVPQQRALVEALSAALDTFREQGAQLGLLETRLIGYLQEVTPYIDTKDYEFHGLARRISEDVAEAHGRLSSTVSGLAAALDGVSDDMLKRWERAEVRHEGLRTSLASMQTAVHALRRELAAQPAAPRGANEPATAATTVTPGTTAARPESPLATRSALASDPLVSHKYMAFEDAFRGDRRVIRERQQDYLPIFAGRQDVLDIGCGRGEFLQLLRERGISGRGVDLNHEMVAACLEAGLAVRETDAMSYLRELPDESLGGVMAVQVVEHLEPDYLITLLDEAFRVLRPGSPIVLETINVTSWSAFFSSYVRDLTHVRPVHPETLRFLVVAAGFLDADIQWRAPLPETEKLRVAPPQARASELADQGITGQGLLALATTFEYNMLHLNQRLFAPLDYAVVAWKR